ncbi:MAG: LysR substrate-binding domain-containing protein [Allorhizobium sp.]
MSRSSSWLPSLNALRAFEAVARHLSFQKAADELHVTSPAVQQLVRGLEDGIGCPLIVRHGRSVAISSAGAAAAPHLREGFERIALGVSRMRTHPQHELKVSVEPSFASSWLISRLMTFQERYPDIHILIDASERLVDLHRGEADIAIRYAKVIGDGYLSWRLFDDETVAVCSPAILSGSVKRMTFADLQVHTLIHFERARLQPDWETWLTAFGAKLPRGGPSLRFTDYNMAQQAALAGQGIALASRPLVQEAIRAGLLIAPFGNGLRNGYGYNLVTTPDVIERHEAKAFVNWIESQARSSCS